jgi:phosphatidylserine decarboxylase
MILGTLIILVVVLAMAVVAMVASGFVLFFSWALVGLWILFVLFSLYFFRDPTPRVPPGVKLVVAPGHGKVDLIDTTEEPQFMGGRCQRVSIFLFNAMKADSAVHNENALIGFESADPAGAKVGVRLIAGLIARRIVPWVTVGEAVQRGERISLIQFGSRVDLYLPVEAKIRVMLGQKVVGGQTIIASFD